MIRTDAHFTPVFVHKVLHALYAVAVINGVFLGCDRQSILYLDAVSLIIVFDTNRRHSHCADHRQRDDAHIGILHQPDGLDGVVQGVSEQGINIRLFHIV